MDRWRLALVALGVMAWLGMVPIPPAAADPVGPTNYRSRVLSVSPTPTNGVVVEILGGDAFVRLQIPRGHTATVPDYSTSDGAGPYLRFDADGTVRRNVKRGRHHHQPLPERTHRGKRPPPNARVAGTWCRATAATSGTTTASTSWAKPGRGPVTTTASTRGALDGTWEIPLVIDGRASTITW